MNVEEGKWDVSGHSFDKDPIYNIDDDTNRNHVLPDIPCHQEEMIFDIFYPSLDPSLVNNEPMLIASFQYDEQPSCSNPLC